MSRRHVPSTILQFYKILQNYFYYFAIFIFLFINYFVIYFFNLLFSSLQNFFNGKPIYSFFPRTNLSSFVIYFLLNKNFFLKGKDSSYELPSLFLFILLLFLKNLKDFLFQFQNSLFLLRFSISLLLLFLFLPCNIKQS